MIFNCSETLKAGLKLIRRKAAQVRRSTLAVLAYGWKLALRVAQALYRSTCKIALLLMLCTIDGIIFDIIKLLWKWFLRWQ